MSFPRASGILCHPTSLPSPFGIGDLGQGAHSFLQWLAGAGQSLWQVLPLGPTGYGDSPYQGLSTFAGNPLLISPQDLVQDGLLRQTDLDDAPSFPQQRVDFSAVAAFKLPLLRRSFERFEVGATPDQRDALAEFRSRQCYWVEDYGLFMALKEHFGDVSWQAWPRSVALREPAAMAHYINLLREETSFQVYVQWIFEEQWRRLKELALSLGIRLIGDIPIFVAEDSADVWGFPHLFKLDQDNRPTVVAGVPPDAFSETGQRWGNPHYCWDAMRNDGFRWWVERIRVLLARVDIIRLDHFRGFEASWEIPSTERTAIQGQWAPGPGKEFFEAIEGALGRLPIIAEDLGVITPEVKALREHFGLPGMKVLQFAFEGDHSSEYLPHWYDRNYVVYPGTHDNNTVIGWFNEEQRGEVAKTHCLRYLGTDGSDLAWDFIRLAWSSVADQAVAALQDVFSQGGDARMNHPSTVGGNWTWRFLPELLTDRLRDRLRELTELYSRQYAPSTIGVD